MSTSTSRPTLRLSPSAVNRFRSCPKSFYFQDVERLPIEWQSSATLAQANAIHEALKLFYSLAPVDRSQRALGAALRTVWRRYATSDVFSSRDAEIDYGRDALAMLTSYWENFDTSQIPIGLEDWVSIRIDDAEFYGKVDRADSRKDGQLDIVDYKTGRGMLDAEELHDEPAAQIYLLGAAATFNKPVASVRFIYLRSGEEICWTPDDRQVEETRERLARLADEIQTTEEFDAWPGPRCRYCPFATRCPDRHKISIEALVGDSSLPF